MDAHPTHDVKEGQLRHIEFEKRQSRGPYTLHVMCDDYDDEHDDRGVGDDVLQPEFAASLMTATSEPGVPELH